MYRGLLVGATAGLVVSIFATPALAAFPGGNGNVAFAESQKLVSEAPSGGRKTLATGPVSAPSYSPNGKKIVYARNWEYSPGFFDARTFDVLIANADGSRKKKLARVEGVNPEPSFSANGKLVIYTNYDGNARGDFRLFTVGIDGKGKKQFAPKVAGTMQDASWSPKGDKIAYIGGPSFKTPKLRTISATGAKSSIKELAAKIDRPLAPDWSPNGKILVFVHAKDPGNSRIVYRVNANNSGVKKLADYGAEMGADNPVWAPNGKKVAFDRHDYGSGGFLGIWTMNPDGSGQRQLDNDGFDPAWQPK